MKFFGWKTELYLFRKRDEFIDALKYKKADMAYSIFSKLLPIAGLAGFVFLIARGCSNMHNDERHGTSKAEWVSICYDKDSSEYLINPRFATMNESILSIGVKMNFKTLKINEATYNDGYCIMSFSIDTSKRMLFARKRKIFLASGTEIKEETDDGEDAALEPHWISFSKNSVAEMIYEGAILVFFPKSPQARVQQKEDTLTNFEKLILDLDSSNADKENK